jgi:nucleoid DNA-binding protein
MTRKDLELILAHEHNFSREKSRSVMRTIFGSIRTALRQWEPVEIYGFAKIRKIQSRFTAKERARLRKQGKKPKSRITYRFQLFSNQSGGGGA